MIANAAAWTALAVSVVGAVPRLISAITRSGAASTRSSVNRFEALYDKQDRLITRLESRCDELERRVGAGSRGRKAH